ncbi:DNA polymerase III subunit chi [Henriciella sp.]|uniref:DNA polymerase III subunit chi n=1 Tax=Henriciella sp. TaxID=1968823 RepID=UPI00261126F7|nr:DNA polymerase III subunit chi [Henriciella sp.]
MSGTGKPEWWFYHLKRTTLEQAAGPLLEKCLERGWRVLAVSPDIRRRGALDAALWTFNDQSFLPHGQAEAAGLDPASQPVLIAGQGENLNEAAVALLMDGAELPVDAPYERCMVMFDDGDAPVRGKARAQYKAAADAGLTTRYFQQTPKGGWTEAG